MLEVEEKRLAAQPAVVIRAKARADQTGPVMGELLPTVWAFVRERAVEPAGPPFSRYLDMEGGEWEFGCGIAVSTPVAGEGRIESGRTACLPRRHHRAHRSLRDPGPRSAAGWRSAGSAKGARPGSSTGPTRARSRIRRSGARSW